jgi:chromosome segregation ATPase
MGITDIAMRPLRVLLGSAEHEVEDAMPVREIEEIQTQILDGVGALRRATESIESHVEVVEALATTLPLLTAAVQELTAQLAEIVTVLAPVTEAEQEMAKVEHEFSRIGGLLGHHREQIPTPRDPGGSDPGGPTTPGQ